MYYKEHVHGLVQGPRRLLISDSSLACSSPNQRKIQTSPEVVAFRVVGACQASLFTFRASLPERVQLLRLWSSGSGVLSAA